jgi:hypothetical protein
MRLDQRKLILGAALIVVLGIAMWSLWRPSPPPRATAPAGAQARARGGRPSANAVSVGPADAVRIDALNASRDEPGEAGRNPFRFQQKAAPPPRVTTPIVTEAPRPGPGLGPSVPAGPPPPPPIQLKLQGVLERANGVKWAVLSDGKSAPMYGKDGDIIDGKYLIVKIGTESIEMSHVDGRGRQVIRLTGQ